MEENDEANKPPLLEDDTAKGDHHFEFSVFDEELEFLVMLLVMILRKLKLRSRIWRRLCMMHP